jgi:PTS system ascorbate-specific IIA component
MTTPILIIAHAPLASALRDCVSHVFAERMNTVGALDVQAHESADEVLKQARALRAGLGQALRQDSTEGHVLVLSDVMGATPCNVAAMLVKDTEDRHVCGVNLPMLWRAVAYQHEPVAQVAHRALEGGQRGVVMPP